MFVFSLVFIHLYILGDYLWLVHLTTPPHPHRHTHALYVSLAVIHIYIYIYVWVCICLCVCVCGEERQRDRQKQTDNSRDRQRGKHTDRQTDIQTERKSFGGRGFKRNGNLPYTVICCHVSSIQSYIYIRPCQVMKADADRWIPAWIGLQWSGCHPIRSCQSDIEGQVMADWLPLWTLMWVTKGFLASKPRNKSWNNSLTMAIDHADSAWACSHVSIQKYICIYVYSYTLCGPDTSFILGDMSLPGVIIWRIRGASFNG